MKPFRCSFFLSFLLLGLLFASTGSCSYFSLDYWSGDSSSNETATEVAPGTTPQTPVGNATSQIWHLAYYHGDTLSVADMDLLFSHYALLGTYSRYWVCLALGSSLSFLWMNYYMHQKSPAHRKLDRVIIWTCLGYALLSGAIQCIRSFEWTHLFSDFIAAGLCLKLHYPLSLWILLSFMNSSKVASLLSLHHGRRARTLMLYSATLASVWLLHVVSMHFLGWSITSSLAISIVFLSPLFLAYKLIKMILAHTIAKKPHTVPDLAKH